MGRGTGDVAGTGHRLCAGGHALSCRRDGQTGSGILPIRLCLGSTAICSAEHGLPEPYVDESLSDPLEHQRVELENLQAELNRLQHRTNELATLVRRVDVPPGLRAMV